MTSRAWTLAEFARAVTLAYGTTRAGTPNVSPLAAQLGVAPRTIQRWIHGDHAPHPRCLEDLHAALLPDRNTLDRQAQDAARAHTAATALAARRASRATRAWREQGWHRPHLLHIISNPDLNISRPLLTLKDRAKPLYLPTGWRTDDVIEVANRPAAVIARQDLLEEVAAWRVRVRPELTEAPTMCWLTHEPSPTLAQLTHQ